MEEGKKSGEPRSEGDKVEEKLLFPHRPGEERINWSFSMFFIFFFPFSRHSSRCFMCSAGIKLLRLWVCRELKDNRGKSKEAVLRALERGDVYLVLIEKELRLSW